MMGKHTNRHRSTLSGDAGFLLVEVMVSAAILIMVSLSVFSMLDQGDKFAGGNQKRAIAANIAQAEIERVRSLPIEDVARLAGTRTITEAGANYSLTATAKWVTDNQDEPDCTSRSGGLDYMRLSTSVSWPNMGNAKPVRLSTIVTPSSRSSSSSMGSLSVYVRDADNAGVSNLLITLDGATDFADPTNVNGCVVFPFIPAGNYTLKFSRVDWVDGDSVEEISQPVSVGGGLTTKVQYMYDWGGTTRTNFVTGKPGAVSDGSGTVPSRPNAFSLFNGDQTRGAKIIELNGTTDVWDGRTDNTRLFPSLDPYAIYAGTCQGNAPTGGQTPTYVNIPRNAHQNAGPTRVPALDFVVYDGTAGSPGNKIQATVVVNSGCGADYREQTNASGALQGRLSDPGFPFSAGTASFCVSGRSSSGTTRKLTRGSVAINDFSDMPADIPVYLNTATTSTNGYANGTC